MAARFALAAAMAAAVGLPLRVGAADPVMFRSGTGRFEIAALDGAAASAVNGMADEAWRLLSGPLGLPDKFSSAILVRLIPAAEWREPAAFRVFVEPGGLVSLRIRWEAQTETWTIRRALAQALLIRQAVAFHGVVANLSAPLWLELGSVGWWHARSEPAHLDALRYETAGVPAPSLSELLGSQRGAAERPALQIGSVWLLTFLQAESGAAEWPALLRRLLGGEAPLEALAAAYPGRFDDEAARELWWQTGWHHLRRATGVPGMSAPESRVAIEALARFVVLDDAGRESVAPLAEVLANARDIWVDVELQRRTTELNRIVSSLHPFYRNAGLSLTLALAERGTAPRREEVCRTFESDLRDSRELEAATTAALDRLEQQLRR